MDLHDDVYQFGLRGTIDPEQSPDLAERILSARRLLHDRLAEDEGLASLIETFDPEKYNANASVGENLLFGNPVGDAFHVDRLAEND